MMRRLRGLSLFEVIAFVAIAAGLAVGVLEGVKEGLVAALWGGLRGAFFGFAGYFVFMLALLSVMALALRWRPMFPTCRQGRCKDADYTYLYLDQPAAGRHEELERKYAGKLVRCKCGTLYLDATTARRFYEVAQDGTLRPFKRFRPFGRWQADIGDIPVVL